MPSSIRNNISSQETVPVVYGNDLFHDSENSRFALGIFSADDILNYEKTKNPLVKGYLQLRANVYIDQANILSDECKRSDGTEIDEYDERSVHFVAFEKRLGGVAVIASTRLIIKNNEDELLPIEREFGDKLSFTVGNGGVEVSRFIINHNEDVQQRKLKSKIMMAALAYGSTKDLGPVVGIIEKKLQRSLALFGISTENIAEPTIVEEGGKNGEGKHSTELIAVRVLLDSVEKRFGKEAIKNTSMDIGDYIYWGEFENNKSQLE